MPILIVSNDAGGANIIASYIAYKKLNCIFYIKGPASEIFLSRLGKKIKQVKSLDLAIRLCEYVICGSGDQSNLEREAIFKAKKENKYVICFIDHWINYRERFIMGEKLILPNQIVASDEEAFRLANLHFKDILITKQKNYYINELLKKINIIKNKIKKNKKQRILYLTEPIKDYISYINSEKKIKYDEYKALKFVCEKIGIKYKNIDEVIIRPHPSETLLKYENIVKSYGSKYKLRNKTKLYYEIANADIIIGCETMAMMIAFLANKKVLCAIPPGSGLCRLPIKNLEYIRDL
jgi:hypothetical protein